MNKLAAISVDPFSRLRVGPGASDRLARTHDSYRTVA